MTKPIATLSQIIEPLSDAWLEAEMATKRMPDKAFRLDFFRRLEQKLHDSGLAVCDFEGCTVHRTAQHD
jgi:hypothetical protein